MSQTCSQNFTSQEIYNVLLECSFSSPLDWADKLNFSVSSVPDAVPSNNCGYSINGEHNV